MKRCIAYCTFLLLLTVSCTSDLGSRAYRSGDYETAAQEWRLLAEQGDAESQAHLGDLYYEGRGVPQSGEESVQWYLMAAEQNHARAQSRLCSIFGGRGFRVHITDQQKAVKWCRKAAEQGSAGSQYRLGRLYLRGEGIPKDRVAAYMFLSIALENGHSRGDREFRSAVRQMTPEQIAEAQQMAGEWMEKHPATVTLDFSQRPVQLTTGLALLSILLVGVRLRHGNILQPIRETLSYRLMLASIGGWLAASFLLPFGFFPAPDTSGFFVPGTFFGLMVMVPMLDHPIRHSFRAAILVWAATIAHAAIWFTGFAIIDLAETYGHQIFLLIYVVAGLAFGTIVSVAMSRILNLQFERSIWFSIAIISLACGSVYVFAVLGELPYWVESIEYFTFSDFRIFFVYVLWYVATAAAFNLGKAQPLAPVSKLDIFFAGVLILITSYIGSALWLL